MRYLDSLVGAPAIHGRRSALLAASVVTLGLMGAAKAAVTAIAVTGYNQDVIVEIGSPANATGVFTATMDGGGTGGEWYEKGYNTSAPATGIPNAGSTITSASQSDHSYTFAPSYGNGSTPTNDAFVVGQGNGNPTVTFTNAGAYSLISFLASAGHGPNTVNYVINFVGGATQTGSIVVGDWFGGTSPAYTTAGRVSVNTGTFDNVNGTNPRIYSYDVSVTNTAAITSISLSSASTSSTAAIFAVSGTAVPEPAAALLGVAGLALGVIRRRR